VTLSIPTLLVIPSPPITVSVSPPETSLVPESPFRVKDVEIGFVVTLVIRPFAATVIVGIDVPEPNVMQ